MDACVKQVYHVKAACIPCFFFPKREVAELFVFLVDSRWTKADFPASEYLRVEDLALPANG